MEGIKEREVVRMRGTRERGNQGKCGFHSFH